MELDQLMIIKVCSFKIQPFFVLQNNMKMAELGKDKRSLLGLREVLGVHFCLLNAKVWKASEVLFFITVRLYLYVFVTCKLNESKNPIGLDIHALCIYMGTMNPSCDP